MALEETLAVELKEFHIPSSSLSKHELAHIHEKITSGEYWGNTRVINGLKHQLLKYFLKYLSGWNHDDLDMESGKLYFGVDDFGKVIGIPFQGKIDIKFINDLIRSELNKTDLTYYQKNEFIKNIKCTAIPVKPQVESTMDIYGEYLEAELERINIIKKFKKDYKKWFDEITLYTGKLVDFLNNKELNKELQDFIKKHCDDIEIKNKLISELSEDKIWEPLPYGLIQYVKLDISNVYHWVTTFKDIRTFQLKHLKPKLKLQHSRFIKYEQFYCSAKYMNEIFSKRKDINFYIIRIEIPNMKSPIKIMSKVGDIIYKREINDLGPCSVPLL